MSLKSKSSKKSHVLTKAAQAILDGQMDGRMDLSKSNR